MIKYKYYGGKRKSELCQIAIYYLKKLIKQIDYLTMNNNEDYVTLVTCTPYAVNTHRLLVRGHRVEYKEEVLSTTVVSKKSTTADIVFYIGITIAIITFIVAIIIIIFINKKNNKTTSYKTTYKYPPP